MTTMRGEMLRRSRENYKDFMASFEKGKWAILGFDFTEQSIAPGQVVTVARLPQVPFLGRYLAVDPGQAPYFSISDIRVGQQSQSVSPDRYPAGIFASPLDIPGDVKWDQVCPIQEDKIGGLRIDLDPAQVAAVIAINIVNIDMRPRYFRAAIFGKIMDY